MLINGGRQSKSALLSTDKCIVHPTMHFSAYVGSEFWFVLDSNAKGTHLTTEGYYFQLFCRPVEKKWDQ